MDYAQKRLDYEQSDRLSTMTEEEKRALRERKAQGLQRVIERADAVLAGNEKLLEKRESEWRSVTAEDMLIKLRERKARADADLAGNKDFLEKRESAWRSVTAEDMLAKLRERKALEVREVMDRADLAFETFRASATGSGE